ncbi:glycosyl transferase family 2 [Hymenobacter roseosalivarius DSM 11622]|uniref:Glycosyl transferase family 2 n=1 Tax=Hymenobacter roseosalivarius DSM 11622 TaxID=645990 RepID=A0A1W1W3X6_9BACT|nr:glycosyltransferase [Hymenobacter roseosalivarius]SMC00319.1 glycosyl transferase family 2 [Hymenobacter roseosalivarius DSM 11622]
MDDAEKNAPQPILIEPEPLVTIVALCHNHAPFLREALDSILAQTYSALEVLLVDNGSTDASPSILREYTASNPAWKLTLHTQNLGLCAGFNQAFRQSRGAFLIDFATDDVLLPQRVAQQVAAFQRLPANYGVVYSDAELIDEQSRFMRHHFRHTKKGLQPRPASGDVFADVLARYFISTPTMMMRRATLDELGGYDETLYYEDFDFWVRAARNWHFYFLDQVTTRKRKHPQAMSRTAYLPSDPHLDSTIQTCYKARALCKNPRELAALAVRLRWEMRQTVRWGNYMHALAFYALLRQTNNAHLLDRLLAGWSRLRC